MIQAVSEIRLFQGAILASRALAELKACGILIARSKKQFAAVQKLVAAAERFEEELEIVMSGSQDDEPPGDFLKALRGFQLAQNEARSAGWSP